MGETNLNVVIVYLHEAHSGRHPRVRSQRNGPQWERTENAGWYKKKGHRVRKEERIKNTVLFLNIFYSSSKGRLCLAALLRNQHTWLLASNIASSNTCIDSSGMED